MPMIETNQKKMPLKYSFPQSTLNNFEDLSFFSSSKA